MRVLFNTPDEFHPQAKKYIKDLVRQLNRENVIVKLDSGALLLLADAINKYYTCRELLLEEGYVQEAKPHPAVKICHEAQVELMKLLVEFGLTPKRRKKDTGKGEKEPQSPIEKFVNDHREVR